MTSGFLTIYDRIIKYRYNIYDLSTTDDGGIEPQALPPIVWTRTKIFLTLIVTSLQFSLEGSQATEGSL